jgi:hypothetical protein
MILQILLNSFIIWGVFYATRYEYSEIERKVTRNEILGFVKKYGDVILPLWLRKPLYDCPMCMASFWSIMSAFYFGLDKYSDIVPIIFGTCGLNYIFNRLFPYSE